MPLQAILFDMDGVIADSEVMWNDIDATLLREFGVTGDLDPADKHAVMGASFPIALGYYRDKYQLRTAMEELIVRRTAIAGEYYAQRIPIFEDAPRVLTELRDMGLKIGLGTSSIAAFVIPFLARHQLSAMFDDITTGEEVEKGKPNPDIYLLAARKAGAEPANCLVVEDAQAGVKAGKSAGCPVAAIPDVRFVKREDYVGRADYILNDLGEVPDLVRRLRAE